MTPQEAINNLNDLIDERKSLISGDKDYDEIFQDDIKSLETAKQALEKQIPKKPLKEYGGAYRCPNCQMKHFDPEWVGTKHCDCGQALDWG